MMAGLLVFGCTSGTATEKKNGPIKAQPDDEIETNETTESDDDQAIIGAFLGKSYAELAALGIPLDCDVKIKDNEGQETVMKLYLKGENFKSVVEIKPTSGADTPCTKFDSIYSNKVIYIGCEDANIFGKCKWISIDTKKAKDSSGNSLTSSATTTDNLEKIPKTDISCKPGLFGDEMFIVTENTCDMAEIFKNLGGSSIEDTSTTENELPPGPE